MQIFEERLADIFAYNNSKTAKTAAAELSKRYNGFSSLAQADYEPLCELCGSSNAVLIRLIASLASRRVTDSFKFGREHSEEEVIEFLKALFLSVTKETVFALPIDSRGRIISAEILGEGTVNSAGILPRRIIEIMVKNKSSRVIIAHNHPNGEAEPSREDVYATAKMLEVFAQSGKELVCHYIVAGNNVKRVEM